MKPYDEGYRDATLKINGLLKIAFETILSAKITPNEFKSYYELLSEVYESGYDLCYDTASKW